MAERELLEIIGIDKEENRWGLTERESLRIGRKNLWEISREEELFRNWQREKPLGIVGD